MSAVRAVLATAGLLLLVLDAVAADIGIPREGLDRVLLDDGRVLEAKVLPREGRHIPLEFPAGTIRVSRDRIRAVRLWKNFDPTPRNDEERSRFAEGYVRWNGKLVTPDRAERLRQDEAAEERKRQEAANLGLPWSEAHRRGAGKFKVVCNASEEEVDFWCDILEALSKKMISTLKGGDYRYITVVVYLYRDESSQRVQLEEDVEQRKMDEILKRFGNGYSRPSDPDERVDLVLGEESREENIPLVLGLSAIKLFHEMMGWQVDDLGGWVRCGVPLYFAGVRFDRGRIRFGVVEDQFLHPFREMMEAGTLPPLESVFRAGNEYWKDAYARREILLGTFRTKFEKEHVPWSWVLVHFLLHGERGKHRGGLTNWVRFWMDTKIGSKRSSVSIDYEKQKALFLRYAKSKNFDALEAAVRKYAEGLEYATSETYLLLARKTADESIALAHIEKAFTLAEGRGAKLHKVGEACSKVAGGRQRAAEILGASVEADPLAPEPRSLLARLLAGEEAERERQLARSLAGIHAPAEAVK